MKQLKYILVFALIGTTIQAFASKRIQITESKLSFDIFFEHGELTPFTGECSVNYYSEPEQIKEIRSFQNGFIHGKSISFFKNGTLAKKGAFAYGKLDGQWEIFYPNGQKKLVANYINDKINGEYREYYSDGKLKYEGMYQNNKRVGTWKMYNTQGLLLKTETFN